MKKMFFAASLLFLVNQVNAKVTYNGAGIAKVTTVTGAIARGEEDDKIDIEAQQGQGLRFLIKSENTCTDAEGVVYPGAQIKLHFVERRSSEGDSGVPLVAEEKKYDIKQTATSSGIYRVSVGALCGGTTYELIVIQQ